MSQLAQLFTVSNKKLKIGEILVEINTEQQFTKLLNHTRMADLIIKVTPYRLLTSSQGVISKSYLINEALSDLLEGLEDQAYEQ